MSTRIKDTNKKTGIARRIKENGYSHTKADARKAKRRAEAEARQVAHAAAIAGLSPEARAARDAQAKRIYDEVYSIFHINSVPGI